jgi:hemolysin III
MPLAMPPRVVAAEIANTIIQGTGTLLSIVGLVVLVHLTIPEGGTTAVASVAVYGGTLILAFLSSTLYHSIGTWHAKAARVLRTADHCTIYLLIAGTYTPIALLVLQDALGWSLLITVWTLALAGVVLRIVWPDHLVKLRIGLYLILGWLVVAWGWPVVQSLAPAGTVLLAGGGLAYSLGVIFYRWQRLPFHLPIWHLFVVLASACHFAAIALYVVPAYVS